MKRGEQLLTLSNIFFDFYSPGVHKFDIKLSELNAKHPDEQLSEEQIAAVFSSFLGDDPEELPDDIRQTAPEAKEWDVQSKSLAKTVKYTFKLVKAQQNIYDKVIEHVFLQNYAEGSKEVLFQRDELIFAANHHGVSLPKNLGDVIYSYRYRKELPKGITSTASEGMEWIIRGMGDAKYKFRLSKINRITPRQGQIVIKVPDATPQIIVRYAQKDEQALLAKIRYNRLVDIFLGITASSLQSHLRTKVTGIGQIEIDEFYVGLDSCGQHYVIPVQAKGGTDKLAVIQTEQDVAYCAQKFPNASCRAVSAQFIDKNRIVMFELGIQDEEVRVVDEQHYELVDNDQISEADLVDFKKWAVTKKAK